MDSTFTHAGKRKPEEELLQFERIAEHCHDLIGVCDLQGKPVYLNQEGLKLLGLENMQTASSVNFTDFFFPEDAEFIESALIPQVMQEDYAEMEIRFRHFQTQEPIWMNYAAFTIKNDAKEIVSIATISRNIDERKKTEKNLRLSMERFHLLADSMPQFVWTGDEYGNLNYFNNSVYTYSGLNPEQIAESGWLQIVHPDERQENIEKWQQAVASGKDFFMEHRFRRHDGTYRWQLSRAIPQRDCEGKIQMWVGTSTDIHDQKIRTKDLEGQVEARNRELVAANAELERINSELTAFAYTSSHDLQAPLRKIQSFASQILQTEKNRLSDQGMLYFGRMQNAAAQMQTLIEDLLAYAQMGKSEKVQETVDLNVLLREVAADLEQTVQEKKAVIEIGTLPIVTVIPFQIRQLFSNLISNALKFSKKDVPPLIQIQCFEENGSMIDHPNAQSNKQYFHLSVQDNGIGFDADQCVRIFEVFHRLHGKHDYSGTGVGLAICKKIAENHEGFITAESLPDHGATFNLYLPIRN